MLKYYSQLTFPHSHPTLCSLHMQQYVIFIHFFEERVLVNKDFFQQHRHKLFCSHVALKTTTKKTPLTSDGAAR